MTTVSFDADIKPVFAQFVGQMRWRLDLTDYHDVRENASLIYNQIMTNSMPPAPFPPLDLDQISRFKAWIDQGFPA
jgi:hypothetical protein